MNKIYDVEKSGQFYIFFEKRDCKDKFAAEYKREIGFGIIRNVSSKGSTYYKLFTSSYCFQAYAQKNKETGRVIGLNVTDCKPLTQAQTLDAAIKRVRVRMLSSVYLIVKYVKGVQTPEIYNNGAEKFFEFVDRCFAFAASAPAAPVKADYSGIIDFHTELIEAQRRFEKEKLVKLYYSGFESVKQNISDGVLYKFLVGDGRFAIANDSKVEVSVNDGGRLLFASVYELANGTVTLKFKTADCYKRLAQSGYICECDNVEFSRKLYALRKLRSGDCAGADLFSVIYDANLEPITIAEKAQDSQRVAIEKAVAAKDFLLIQGPPGTGKTTIIVEMVRHFAKQGMRVLICSKNNLPVDNVLEKCKDLYFDEQKTQHMQCLRLGGEEENVLKSVQCFMPRYLAKSIRAQIEKDSRIAQASRVDGEAMLAKNCTDAIDIIKDICTVFDRLSLISQQLSDINRVALRNILSIFFGPGKRRGLIQETKTALELCSGLQEFIRNALCSESAVDFSETFEKADKIQRILASICLKTDAHPIVSGLVLGKGADDRIRALAYQKPRLADVFAAVAEGYNTNPAASVVRQLGQWQSGDSLIGFLKDRALQAGLSAKHFESVLGEWQAELARDNEALEAPLVRCARIIGATCIGVNSQVDLKDAEYDVAIVDEAGQIILHDLLVPLVKAKKTILIGDHLQLPPSPQRDLCTYIDKNQLVGLSECESDEQKQNILEDISRLYSVSLFEKLYRDPRFESHRHMLCKQYRMHPDIASFVSDNFYEKKYFSGVSAMSRQVRIAGFEKPIYFIDTALSADKAETCAATADEEKKYYNALEAKVLSEIIANLVTSIENSDFTAPQGVTFKDKEGMYDIGIITAYKLQVEHVKARTFELLCKRYEGSRAMRIMSMLSIKTLDSFQGRDNEIILYSFVRSNDNCAIGFMNELRRINVMMTRAKSLLVMVGDSATLTRTRARAVHSGQSVGQFFDRLITHCKDSGEYLQYMKGLEDE